MVDKPIIEHVTRRASMPWRHADTHLTECGKPVRDHQSITFDDFTRKVRVQGRLRASMSTCMTCWQTATRYQPWNVDPVDAIRREVHGMRGDSDAFRHELWALATLVEAHRAEFDDYITGLRHTTDLASRRRAKRTTGTQ
jgi:hypothetical protein